MRLLAIAIMIFIIEIIAIQHGINGTGISISVGTLGAIAGWIAKTIHRRKTR